MELTDPRPCDRGGDSPDAPPAVRDGANLGVRGVTVGVCASEWDGVFDADEAMVLRASATVSRVCRRD